MSHDDLNDLAARRILAESLPAFAIVEALYAPSGPVPAWARQFAGQRTQWLVNGDIEHMTPYPLPISADEPARWVDLQELRDIELAGSLLDD